MSSVNHKGGLHTEFHHVSSPLHTEVDRRVYFEPNNRETHKFVLSTIADSIKRVKYHKTELITWRKKLGRQLESQYMHLAILVLVLVDFCIVMAEIIISYVEMDAGMQPSPAVMEPLRYTSLVILSIFCVENLLKLVAFGFQYYWKHPMHLLDVALVLTSLFLTIYLHAPAQEIVGLVILLRTWRIVRVIESVVLTLCFKHTKFKEKVHENFLRQKILLVAARARLIIYKRKYGKLCSKDYEKLHELI